MFACYYCKGKNHNSALCFKKFGTPRGKNTKAHLVSNVEDGDKANDEPVNVVTAMATKDIDDTILPIVEIPISNPNSNKLQKAPALMDCGSMASYITFACAEKLRLPVISQEKLNIETFNCTEPLVKDTKLYSLKVQRKNGEFDNVQVFGVENITKKMTMAIRGKFKDIVFKSTVPEILIGSNYFWKFFKSQQLPSGFYQAETEFGPIICGAGPTVVSTNVTTLTVYTDTLNAIEELEAKVAEQWKLENIGIVDDPEKTDRQIVDDFFNATAYRNQEGRYIVRLPWKTDNPVVPDHKDMCFYRLQTLAKKLKADGKLDAMMNVLKDHFDRGFIEFVTPEMDSKCILKHYIPYHCVYKESLTTPLRVVFDCSAKYGKNGTSLNSLLYNGPPIMPNPVGLMIRFRSQPVVVTADIAKAFMQILLNENDRDVFRFLLIDDPEKPVTRENIREARYTRPLFGSGPSPLLLEQVIRDRVSELPDPTAKEILENNWVDNVKLDGENAATVIQKAKFAKEVFAEIGMELREFVSNDDEVNGAMESSAPESTTFLGVPWKPKEDMIVIRVPVFKKDKNTVPSKRAVLSAIASIYDPCGLISPIVLKGKCYIQRLWKRKVAWDEPLNDEEDKNWWNNFKLCNENKELSLQRCIIQPNAVKNQLHVFCDASKNGYSAVAYIRQQLQNNSFVSNIIVAKSRVTDIEKTTIPKLELIATTIGSSLLDFVQKELNIEFEQAVLWTDSTCVIGWLASSEMKLGRFVENRLKHIKERVKLVKHVRTDENPADIGSRGIDFDELAKNKLWWHGPEFLLLQEKDWPTEAVKSVNLEKIAEIVETPTASESSNFKRKAETTTLKVAVKKVKPEECSATEFFAPQNYPPVNERRFSKWRKFVGATAAVLYCTKRFWVAGKTFVVKKLMVENFDSFNDPKMIELAENAIILNIQRKYPPTEKMINELKLTVDCYGFIVITHRMPVDENSPPLIWIPKCYEVELLILSIHTKNNFHIGPRHTLNELRQKYWIASGKSVVTNVIKHQCFHCINLKVKPYHLPPMPDLPLQRTRVANPFQYTGVDYAGPFTFSHNGFPAKIYIILFTCMVTRNIHLEVTTTAHSIRFIMAFRRFIARRSRPSEIYSDHGTNFVLAKKAIEPWWDTENDPELKEFLKAEKIQWNFIKEKSPWKGGFYERMIGLMKHTLKHAMGRKLLNHEEFCTLAVEIESIINCRPITPVDPELKHDDSNLALRPIDFLVQEYHGYFPPSTATEDDPTYVLKESNESNLKTLYNQTAICRERFWKKWQVEYLNLLRERTTHYHKQRKFTDAAPKVGTVVHICDDNGNYPENAWRLGLITELNVSNDKEIRTAKVKLANGRILTRPINFLYPLEVQINDPNTINNEKPIAEVTTIPQVNENRHNYNLRSRGKTTTMLALASCNSTAETQTAKKSSVHRNPATTWTLFLTILSCIIFQAYANPCSTISNAAELVAAEYCQNSGLVIFKQKNEYCHSKWDCKELYIRGKKSSNGKYCGERCYCPSWSSACSFYEGPAHENSTIKNQKVKQMLAAARPETKSAHMFQIQLADQTKHLVSQLDIQHQQLDPKVFECIGKGNITSGTPYYCAHHDCQPHASRYCYYQTHETVYWIYAKMKIPIVAWGIIDMELEEEKPRKRPPATVRCSDGTVYGNSSMIMTLIEISSNTHYYAEYVKNVNFKVELPRTFATASRIYDINIVYSDEFTEQQSVHCEEIDFCSHISCYICIDQLLNPDCAPFKVLLIVLNLLLVLWTTMCYCCCWRRYRKQNKEYYLPIYQAPTKRKNSDANEEDMNLHLLPAIGTPKSTFQRQQSTANLTTFMFGVLMLSIFPGAHSESSVIAITATSNTCEADAHGWIQCAFEQASELFLSSSTEATLLLKNDENIPFGTLKIVPSVQHICLPTTEYFTRIVEISSASNKRCPGMGQCFGTNCATMDKNDYVEGIGKANFLPGVTGCVESCGGLACGCVGWNEACTFFRFFTTPINNNVIKVQHCNTWKTIVQLNITLIGQQKIKEQHVIILEEGETVNTNQISYSLLNINQKSTMNDIVVIDNGKTAALVDQFGIAASKILKCSTEEDAISFTNSSCILQFEACRCRPADGMVHCDCRSNTVLKQYLTDMRLPRQVGGDFLQRMDEKILITSNSRLQIKVGLQKLQLSTVVDRNKCKATVNQLSGCINCMAGAMLNISCLTDFGTANAHVNCKSTSFAIQCTTKNHQQTINLQLDQPTIDEVCELQCPGEKSNFQLKGTLWKAKDESNNWLMANDRVAASTSMLAEAKEIIESIKNFFFTNFLYLILLITSFIVLIVVLKLF